MALGSVLGIMTSQCRFCRSTCTVQCCLTAGVLAVSAASLKLLYSPRSCMLFSSVALTERGVCVAKCLAFLFSVSACLACGLF